jgi:hypothetical protein
MLPKEYFLIREARSSMSSWNPQSNARTLNPPLPVLVLPWRSGSHKISLPWRALHPGAGQIPHLSRSPCPHLPGPLVSFQLPALHPTLVLHLSGHDAISSQPQPSTPLSSLLCPSFIPWIPSFTHPTWPPRPTPSPPSHICSSPTSPCCPSCPALRMTIPAIPLYAYAMPHHREVSAVSSRGMRTRGWRGTRALTLEPQINVHKI